MSYFKSTSLICPFKVNDVDLKPSKNVYIYQFLHGCVSCFNTKFTLLLDSKIVDNGLLSHIRS